jgi:malonyl-CoA O-methyltransferase
MSLPPPSASAKLSAPIDLPLVRRRFGQPQRVAESDFLRREVSARMQERLALVKIAPREVWTPDAAKAPTCRCCRSAIPRPR